MAGLSFLLQVHVQQFQSQDHDHQQKEGRIGAVKEPAPVEILRVDMKGGGRCEGIGTM